MCVYVCVCVCLYICIPVFVSCACLYSLNGWVCPFSSVFVLVCVLIGYMYICTSVSSICICAFLWLVYMGVYDHVHVFVSYFGTCLHARACVCCLYMYVYVHTHVLLQD